MHTNVVFARVGWMRYYGARPEADGPQAGGSYNENDKGAEIENFKARNGRLFGFVRIPSGAGFNQVRVTGNATAAGESMIVLFAKRPGEAGQVVVGWRRTSDVSSEVKWRTHDYPYNWTAPANKAVLLSIGQRTWVVPKGKGATGQSNVLYPRDKHGKLIERRWADDIVPHAASFQSVMAAGMIRR